jgi:hypothetical protein
MYYKKIIIWLSANEEFSHEDKNEAIRKASLEFNKVLETLQDRLGFEAIKDKKHGIKLLKHHLAYTNAPEWEHVTEEKVFITYKGEDGKIWLQYDRSKGVKEREYVHNETAVDDSDALEKFFTDFKDNRPPTNTELATQQKWVVDVLARYATQMELHLKVQREQLATNKEMRETLKDIR